MTRSYFFLGIRTLGVESIIFITALVGNYNKMNAVQFL